jgi:coenzyme F420-reducing hydrogenase beta subunit
LENLLMQDFVDRVVCVTAQADSEKLFRFAVFDSVDLLRRASGSVYYPVELSDVVRFILDHPGRFALVGLPCFIKAIRLAQIENPLLRERLKYLLGLVCGQTKSRLYTRFISAMAGVSDPPVEVFYRKKDFRRPSRNYAFEVRSTTGRRGTLGRLDGVGRVWGSRMFTPRACNYCDDVYAELADVALMDAWLPEYENEALGANLVITRSPDLERILVEAGHANRIHLENLEITPIIQSQEGVLRIKREQLAYRLCFAEKETGVRVTKRVPPGDGLDFIEKKEVRLRDRIQKKCVGEYLRLQRHGCTQPGLLFQALMPELTALRFWEKCRKYARLPRRILAKVKKIVGLKG